MLTRIRLRRVAVLLVSAASLVAAMLLTFVTPASAAMCPVYDEDGNLIRYENCEPGDPGGPGDEDDPPPDDNEPSCEKPDVVTDPYGDFFWCEGEIWCQGTIAVTDPPEDAPPKPHPDAVWIFYTCWNETEAVDQGFQWDPPPEVDPPTLAERAVTAYGQLVAPPVSLAFDPNNTTYVGTDTTFWADGPTSESIEGSEALGLIARTVNGQVMVDPGDGSGTLACGWAVDQASGQASGCVRAYDRSSVGGGSTDAQGQPAFGASVWLEFDVEFVLNGQVIDVPGLDDQYLTWETPPVGGTVAVGEVQVIID